MHVPGKKKLVLLGMMSRMPVAGVVWQTVQYLVGLQRLGYEVYYVEAHACSPSSFIATEAEDGSDKAADFIAGVMRRFDLGDRWAFHALHSDGRCYGLSNMRLQELYRSAALLINLHGGTMPLPEQSATGRLVFLETDPVELQIELYHNRPAAVAYLEPHCAFFTFGENYGRPGCKLPVADRFPFRPTRQPVVMDFWDCEIKGTGCFFREKSTLSPLFWTTIGSWRQEQRNVTFQGEVYRWSKHYEFLKFLELPARTGQRFELALSAYTDADRQLLEKKGWRVRPAVELSEDLDAYRAYIACSRGEFTVAKDQNVRLRTGWFSDRSATYLAAGRPVITQETGFSESLPSGRGLFAFETMDDILAALDRVAGDYAREARAAREIAETYFAAERVLGNLLAEVGL
jgi:hypothetical protein